MMSRETSCELVSSSAFEACEVEAEIVTRGYGICERDVAIPDDEGDDHSMDDIVQDAGDALLIGAGSSGDAADDDTLGKDGTSFENSVQGGVRDVDTRGSLNGGVREELNGGVGEELNGGVGEELNGGVGEELNGGVGEQGPSESERGAESEASPDDATVGGARAEASPDGATVGGATVGGATVGGATVGGATVGGATVGGATVGGATVGGATVGGATVGGATVGGARAEASPDGASAAIPAHTKSARIGSQDGRLDAREVAIDCRLRIGGVEFELRPREDRQQPRRTGRVGQVAEARRGDERSRILARVLRDARAWAELSQTALAERLRRSAKTVGNAELGRGRVGERYVVAVLAACGLPRDWRNWRDWRDDDEADSEIVDAERGGVRDAHEADACAEASERGMIAGDLAAALEQDEAAKERKLIQSLPWGWTQNPVLCAGIDPQTCEPVRRGSKRDLELRETYPRWVDWANVDVYG